MLERFRLRRDWNLALLSLNYFTQPQYQKDWSTKDENPAIINQALCSVCGNVINLC